MSSLSASSAHPTTGSTSRVTTHRADSNPTLARHLRPSSGGQLLQVLTQLENIAGGIGGIREALGRE